MTAVLTPEQIEQFNTEGYVTPVRIMDVAEAGTLRSKLEAEGYEVDPTQTGMNINELSRSIERLKNELLRSVGSTPQSVNNIDASTNSNTSNMNIGSTSVANTNNALNAYATIF